MRVERTETKYMLSVDEYGDLINLLPQLLEADENNGDFGYRIMSLYFDSILNRDYYDKVDGLENRKKIRLRYYGQNFDKIKLEMKIKKNKFQAKESIWISREDALLLQNCEYECLNKYKDPIADKIRHIMSSGCYRPVVRVEYLRKAFIAAASATRVTFDSELRVSETSLGLFDSSDNLDRIPSQFYAILEVKNTGELPKYLKSQLNQFTQSSRAVSKYKEARWLFEELNVI